MRPLWVPPLVLLLIASMLPLYSGASETGGRATGSSSWSLDYSGGGEEQGTDIVVDSEGNVIITGLFDTAVDFGGGLLTAQGQNDTFLAKFSPSGVHLWSFAFGSSGNDFGLALTTDPSNNIYLAGMFAGSIDAGGGTLNSNGAEDILLASYTSSGQHRWSSSFGGSASDWPTDVDADGTNLLLSGQFQNGIDLGGGTMTSIGGSDVFVSKFDLGGTFVWSRRYGSTGNDIGRAVAINSTGGIAVGGVFQGSVDFGGGVLTTTAFDDSFVMQLDSAGNHAWSYQLGGQENETIRALDTNSMDGVIVGGYFSGDIDFGSTMITSAGGNDGFMAGFDRAGTRLWGHAYGGGGGDIFRSLAVDSRDHIVFAGYTYSSVIDMGGGSLNNNGSSDMVLAKYGPSGGYLWALNEGGSDPDFITAVAMDGNGSVAVNGAFAFSTDLIGSTFTSDGVLDGLVWMYYDSDDDGLTDDLDNCPVDDNPGQSDHNSDGDGDACDPDDDLDGVLDVDDNCPLGALGWTSIPQEDYDGDGCRDATDDLDDDGDGIVDTSDDCDLGNLGWISNSSTDNDQDGCEDDSSEDLDDDNDGAPDTLDDCPQGETGWSVGPSTDHDSDGCRDLGEDLDDDNDNVTDLSDGCQPGETGWASDSGSDNDGDGCRDSTEDLDDDNDGVPDLTDNCQLDSNPLQEDADNDTIGDACDPLTDPDGDGVDATVDNCPLVANADQADTDIDGTGDECDSDDDNDGVPDSIDECPQGAIGWTSNLSRDPDGDGCESFEDLDDDGDGVLDTADYFPDDPTESSDTDGDGVGDNTDSDADGDCFPATVEQAEGTSDIDASDTPPDEDGDCIPDSTDEDSRDAEGVQTFSSVLITLGVLLLLGALTSALMIRFRPTKKPRKPGPRKKLGFGDIRRKDIPSRPPEMGITDLKESLAGPNMAVTELPEPAVTKLPEMDD